MKWIKIVRKRVNKTNDEKGSPFPMHALSVEELIPAEVAVIKSYQRMKFKEEFMVLDGRRNRKLKESIGCLNPYVGEDGLIRVGGRFQQSNLDEKGYASSHVTLERKDNRNDHQMVSSKDCTQWKKSHTK